MTYQVLPIYDITDDVIETLAGETCFILTVLKSSGKSTQVLQILRIRGLVGTGDVILLAICPKLPKRADLSWPVLTQECVFPEFANSIV